MTGNYLFYNSEYPAHYSIGAVILDNQKVMCHHFKKIADFEDLYILMRESPLVNESVEQTLARGAQEEFGASVEIVHYLGSIISRHSTKEVGNIQKTTLYFLCNLIDFKPETRAKDDPESGSEILFLPIDELMSKMASQAERYHERTDLDEREILQRLKSAI